MNPTLEDFVMKKARTKPF